MHGWLQRDLLVALLLAGGTLLLMLGSLWLMSPPGYTLTRCPWLPPADALPAADLLLHEPFSRPASSHLQTGQGAAWRYAHNNDAYLVDVREPELLVWSIVEGSYDNIQVQVDTAQVTGPPTTASGLTFRYQDPANFYLFNVANNGFYNLELVENGQHTILINWTPSAVIQTAPPAPPNYTANAAAVTYNALRVDLQGQLIGLFVNGSKLESTIDSTFADGAVGVAVNTSVDGAAVVCFDNLMVVRSNN